MIGRWLTSERGILIGLTVFTLLVTVALTLSIVAVRSLQSQQDRQREGRKLAVETICGIEQATIDAGRAQLLSGANLKPDRFRRNLERLGYPPRELREKAARQAALAYSSHIAKAVERESGVRGLVKRDGTLRCDLLVRASGAAKP